MSRADFPHHRRRSTRLKGYDYTRAGAYFITICTYDRMQLFGHVVDGKIVLNACGEIVRDEWFRTARVRSNVLLFDHEFIIMPNHIHGIIRIMDTETHVGATRRVALRNVCRVDLPRGRWGRSSDSSNLLLPVASIYYAVHPACPYDNAIITNTSSATGIPWTPSANTSSRILSGGMKITIIPTHRNSQRAVPFRTNRHLFISFYICKQWDDCRRRKVVVSLKWLWMIR